MPLDEQRTLFLSSLEQASQLDEEMSLMVEAWRTGDVDQLHDMLFESLEGMESLYDQLVVKRNENWISRIEEMLGQQDDYLVIVGAGHLAGEEGVVELLRQRGLEVIQH